MVLCNVAEYLTQPHRPKRDENKVPFKRAKFLPNSAKMSGVLDKNRSI